MYQTVHNVGKPLGVGICLQDIENILQNRHFTIPVRMLRIIQRIIIMGNSLFLVSLDECFIKELPFFMRHIRYEQREENVQSLYFGCKLGFIRLRSVQQVVCGGIHLTDFHDVDTVFGGRRDRNKFSAYIAAGTMELMSF